MTDRMVASSDARRAQHGEELRKLFQKNEKMEKESHKSKKVKKHTAEQDEKQEKATLDGKLRTTGKDMRLLDRLLTSTDFLDGHQEKEKYPGHKGQLSVLEASERCIKAQDHLLECRRHVQDERKRYNKTRNLGNLSSQGETRFNYCH